MTRRAPAGIYYLNTPIHETDTAVELLASATRVAAGTGVEVTDDLIEEASALQLVLNVSLATTPTTPLVVEIQAKVGTLWYTLARFDNLSAAAIKLIPVKRGIGSSSAIAYDVAVDPAVGSGIVNNQLAEWGSTLRVKWGMTGSYTFSVTAYPIR